MLPSNRRAAFISALARLTESAAPDTEVVEKPRKKKKAEKPKAKAKAKTTKKKTSAKKRASAKKKKS